MSKKVITGPVLVAWERRVLHGCYMKHHRDLCSTELHSYLHNVVCRVQWPLATVEVNQESLYPSTSLYLYIFIKYFLVLVHIHCREFDIFNSHDLLPSDLVAQSVEQR